MDGYDPHSSGRICNCCDSYFLPNMAQTVESTDEPTASELVPDHEARDASGATVVPPPVWSLPACPISGGRM